MADAAERRSVTNERASFETVPGKYLKITSFKRDGTPVSTPVWFVQTNGRLLVQTEADSFKVRRIHRNPRVVVTPCTATGRARGAAVEARAQILPDTDTRRVERLIAWKYWRDLVVIRPARALQRTLRPGKTSASVALSIRPAEARSADAPRAEARAA